MLAYLVTFILALLLYLLFTAGSGTLWLWSPTELIASVLLALLTSAVAGKILCRGKDYRMANPLRIVALFLYLIGPFLLEVIRANLDVAYRVITGRIRPGIIKVSSGMKTDFSVFLLANSITLTPGTITVDIDEGTNDLYIHNINVPEGWETRSAVKAEELFSLANLPAWIRRIAE